MKKIGYIINTGVKNIYEEEYKQEIKDTNDRIDNYIEKNEFHELIHCFLFRLFNINSIIIYTFRYSPYFFGYGACCLPLSQDGIIRTVILDILHTLWDLLSDFLYLRFRENTIRSPLSLIKILIEDIQNINKFRVFAKYQSIDEIKIRANNESLETLKNLDQGINSV